MLGVAGEAEQRKSNQTSEHSTFLHTAMHFLLQFETDALLYLLIAGPSFNSHQTACRSNNMIVIYFILSTTKTIPRMHEQHNEKRTV